MTYLLLIAVTQMLAFELSLSWRLIVALWSLALLVAGWSWAGEGGSPGNGVWAGGSGTWTLIRLWVCEHKTDWKVVMIGPNQLNKNKKKNTKSLLVSMLHWCCCVERLLSSFFMCEAYSGAGNILSSFLPTSDGPLLPAPIILSFVIFSAETG